MLNHLAYFVVLDAILFFRFERELIAYHGSARLWDDDVILPGDTRKVHGTKSPFVITVMLSWNPQV